MRWNFEASRPLLLALALAAAVPVAAQAEEFFAGKTVRMIIGFGVGGGYDLWGRTVARHIGKHIPGKPEVIPQNMEGAGSFRAANYIFNVAPKDGTVMALIARDAALGPITGAPGAQFDPTKLSWIGTPTKETNICIAYKTAQVKTAQDLFERQLLVGDTGPGTGTRAYPKVLSALLGLKFRIVGGYPSSADVFLAMERGEVEGICESFDSVATRRPTWISGHTVSVLFQGGAAPNPQLKDVPFVLDFARNAQDKQAIAFLYAGQGIGRPFVAPPGLPAERLQTLRASFDATMKDPDFLADVHKHKFEIEAEDGAQLAALINQIYATPKAIVDKIGNLLKQ